jgi:hypothetical protein
MADEFSNIGIGVFHGLLPPKAGRLSPFGTIDFFEEGDLLGLGKFYSSRFPAGPAEAATVLGAALAITAIRAFFPFLSCRMTG